MKGAYRFLRGSYRVRFSSDHPERILDLTHRHRLPVWNIEKKEGEVLFSVSPDLLPTVKGLVVKGEGESLTWERGGILILWDRFCARIGLFLGFAIFLLSSVLSTFFVWSVEVEGNSTIPEREICAMLEREGLRPGVPISSVNTGEFALGFQVNNNIFSHVSLNIIGTRAILSVREREMVEEEAPPYDGAANLVADISGEILRYEVLAGQVCVKRGDVVPKGTLLISGVVEKSNGAFTTLAAKGRVFAKTTRYFEATVPYEKTETVYTGREEKRCSYEILGLTLSPPFFNSSPYESDCVLESCEPLSLFGRDLPILCTTRFYCETEEKNELVTVDRAEKLAYDKYEEYKRDTLPSDYEILEENVTLTHSEEGVTISVELVLSEDIARSSPFSIVEKAES